MCELQKWNTWRWKRPEKLSACLNPSALTSSSQSADSRHGNCCETGGSGRSHHIYINWFSSKLIKSQWNAVRMCSSCWTHGVRFVLSLLVETQSNSVFFHVKATGTIFSTVWCVNNVYVTWSQDVRSFYSSSALLLPIFWPTQQKNWKTGNINCNCTNSTEDMKQQV